MDDVSARIQRILRRRAEQLPRVRADIEWWSGTDRLLAELDAAVDALREHPNTPDELRASLTEFRVEQVRQDVTEAVRLLRTLETRFARDTVNIGVSGQARVGKSTMLQSVSGLGDDQIPTGEGLPVTAVRSRIYHSAEFRRATLRLHSFAGFADEVLAPYHAELRLPGLPASVAEFAAWPYPEPKPAAPGGNTGDDTAEPDARQRAMLIRLREMQASLPSYAADLVGTDRVVQPDGLRPLVAYPTNDELGADGVPSRRYLAVAEVRIDCPFPHAQVEHLGIIDLPGLGELTPRAEVHHVAGLRNEVDVVLLVKRPVEGMAFWGASDARALALVSDARVFVSNRDFAFVVLNTGGQPAGLVAAQRDDVLRQLNNGVPDQFHRVLETDARNPSSVFETVLEPVLEHLAARLPAMDQEMLAGTRAELRAVADRVGGLLADLTRLLAGVKHSSTGAVEELDRRAVRLRQDLAGPLIERVTALREQARAGAEDADFVAAADRTYAAARRWIDSGLGVGEQRWRADGLRTMQVDRNSSGYAGDQLNRVRVEIATLFEGIDVYFTERVRSLYDDIAALLAARLGTLLHGYTGEAAIRRFAELLSDASEPCPTLSRAVRQLLSIRLDYRSQLHPRVRAELDGLNLEVRDPRTGLLSNQIVVEPTEAGAQRLYRFVVQLAEQAAYLTRKALLAESVMPALVLHAAAEQFEDTLIRSGDSEREFRRLARSYRDEIWPGVFPELDAANARVASVLRGRDTLSRRLREVPGAVAGATPAEGAR